MRLGKGRATGILLRLLLVLQLFPCSVSAYWIQHSNFALDPAASPEQFRPAADGTKPAPGKKVAMKVWCAWGLLAASQSASRSAVSRVITFAIACTRA